MIRIIIDTNLWIKFLITKDFFQIEQSLINEEITLLFSDELLTEFIEVTSRPKFKKYFTKIDVDNILSTMHHYAEFINVTTSIDLCRDPKDNFLLALSIDGKANYLVSGDLDLISIKKIKKTKIISISNFIKEVIV